MNKTSIRGCPICQETQCDVLHSQKFILPEGHPLVDGYDVVCCDRCGFVYADTATSQRDYDALYARFSKYEDDKTSTGGGESSWDAERLKQTAACLAEVLTNKQARILDIGCANGGLLNAFKRLGYTNLCGLDPSPGCVANTQRLLGIEAFVGSLSSVPDHLGQFDCVVLSHVLEHIQDLKPAVQRIGELIKQDGIAYIEVPDASRYAEFVLSPFQDFNTEHINHFSLQCLANLFQSAGWIGSAQGQRVIYSAPDTPYPAIYAVYVRLGAETHAIQRDPYLCDSIQVYIARSQEIMDAIETKLQQVLQTAHEVIVWGTGQLAMKLLAETCLGKAQIAAFVDGNPINQGKLLRGCPIVAPNELKQTDLPIVITSILHGQEIANIIRNHIGLPNPIVLL